MLQNTKIQVQSSSINILLAAYCLIVGALKTLGKPKGACNVWAGTHALRNFDKKLNVTDTASEKGGGGGEVIRTAGTMSSHHKPSEVSWNFSLLFFFRHFHGLKILPRVENLPLRFGGGVLSPVLPPSPTIVLWCRSASSSEIKATI